MKKSIGIVSSLLGLIGFTAGCRGSVMYGTPMANYKIITSVTDELENPVPGIQVTPLKIYKESTFPVHSSQFTDKDGKVTLSFSTFPENEEIAVAFSDEDGEAGGGKFVADTVQHLNFTQTKKGSGHWNMGSYESEVKVKLKKH